MTMGVNDSLVEVTAAIAGLTIALQNARLVALAALITGLAGSLSMAASEYLEKETEEVFDKNVKSPAGASIRTGLLYFGIAMALIIPFLLLQSYVAALTCTLAIAFTIVVGFTIYITKPEDRYFWKEFPKRITLSFGIAAIAFLLAYGLRLVLGVSM
jgi:VIT1/CCC1 family predicted Fe2+/Mn2+ transporter